MNRALAFVREHRFVYAAAERVSPAIRRVTARNPGPYTFHGTGTYIVGHGQVAVIDPGPLLDEHLTAIDAAIAGEELVCILVSHCHRDHAPASRPLAARHRAPVLAFGADGRGGDSGEEGIDREFMPDRRLVHGERLHGPGWTIDCVHTPGHTADHMCFAFLEEGALFTGDHVMAWATSVIAHPDGDLGSYLDSLERLLERPDRTYWPTHGPPLDVPHDYVSALLDHRRGRLTQILDAVDDGADTPRRITAVLYAGLDWRLRDAALRSTLAGVQWLAARGRLAIDGPLAADSTLHRLAR